MPRASYTRALRRGRPLGPDVLRPGPERVVCSLGDERLLRHRGRRPDRNAHAEPAARAPPPVVMLDHVRGGVGLQLDRSKIVAYKPAGVEPALPLIAGNRSREVAVAVGHSTELP